VGGVSSAGVRPLLAILVALGMMEGDGFSSRVTSVVVVVGVRRV
jgi:hypothetical protein